MSNSISDVIKLLLILLLFVLLFGLYVTLLLVLVVGGKAWAPLPQSSPILDMAKGQGVHGAIPQWSVHLVGLPESVPHNTHAIYFVDL